MGPSRFTRSKRRRPTGCRIRPSPTSIPSCPRGAGLRPSPALLRVRPTVLRCFPSCAARGNLVNAAGKIVWPARPDLPLTVNSQLAAAFLEWVDEFQLSEEDVPGLSRSVLGRLLVLQAGPSGLPPVEPGSDRRLRSGHQVAARSPRRRAAPLSSHRMGERPAHCAALRGSAARGRGGGSRWAIRRTKNRSSRPTGPRASATA